MSEIIKEFMFARDKLYMTRFNYLDFKHDYLEVLILQLDMNFDLLFLALIGMLMIIIVLIEENLSQLDLIIIMALIFTALIHLWIYITKSKKRDLLLKQIITKNNKIIKNANEK